MVPNSPSSRDAKATPTRQRSKQQAKKDRIAARERFRRAHLAEKAFARKLKSVAKQVGSIVKSFAPKGVVRNLPQLTKALNKYSEMLRPWAQAISKSLVEEVAQRDARAWAEMGRDMGRALRSEIRFAPTGKVMQGIMEEQVDLISSIPRQAAERVHKLTIEAMAGGVRARESAREIMRTTSVTESKAMLIARTETTRTATAMVEARATFVGSEGYIWRTAGDTDVRKLHKELEGKFIKWKKPPIAGENGERAHAGSIYNCRCYPEPVLPDVV